LLLVAGTSGVTVDVIDPQYLITIKGRSSVGSMRDGFYFADIVPA